MSEEIIKSENAPEITRKDFVGREDEMSVIGKAILEKDNNIVNIKGFGGIGKTSLLNEVQRRYSKKDGILISGLIDFIDISIHTWLGFLDEVVNSLHIEDKKIFEAYRRAKERYEEIEFAGVSGYTLKEEKEKILETFRICYANLAETVDKKNVILMDTFELVHSRLGKWLIDEWLKRLIKTTIIIAGREEKEWQKILEQAEKDLPVYHLPLKELKLDETQQLFSLTQAGQIIGDTECQKLQILSGGRPILLALALDWRSRGDIPEDALTSTSSEYSLNDLQEIQKNSPAQLEDIQKQFCIELVERFQNLDTHNQVIRYMVYMAVVYKKFTPEILAYIGKMSIDKAKFLLKEMESLPFIKYNPRTDSYQLHDLIRDLINEHVWKKIDPIWGERRNICEKAAAFYSKLIGNIENDKKTWRENKKYAEATADKSSEIEALRKLITLKRLQQNYRLHRIYYWIIADYEKGIQQYRYLFTNLVWAREREVYELVRIERELAIKLLGKIYPEEQIILEEALINIVAEGKPGQGLKILDVLLNKVNKDGDKQLYSDILLYQGIAFSYKGETQSAIERLEDVINILYNMEKEYGKPLQYEDLYARWIARTLGMAYGSLGFAYRAAGQISKASQFYRSSIKYHKMGAIKIAQAASLNDLSYVYARMGKYEISKRLCEEGLEIREELQSDYYIGLSYNTLGAIEYQGDKPFSGKNFSMKALRIFERISDKRGIGMANITLGANLRLINQQEPSIDHLKDSEGYLLKAEEIFKTGGSAPEPLYLAQTYEHLGLLYQNWGKFLKERNDKISTDQFFKAERYFQDCIHAYRAIKATWQVAIATERLFSLYSSDLNELEKAYNSLKEVEEIVIQEIPSDILLPADERKPLHEIKIERHEFVYPLGKMTRGKGRMTFMAYRKEGKMDDLEKAVEYYTLACAYLELFSEKSRAMKNTIDEIMLNLKLLSVEDRDIFVKQVQKTYLRYGLEKYDELIRLLEDYMGIVMEDI